MDCRDFREAMNQRIGQAEGREKLARRMAANNMNAGA